MHLILLGRSAASVLNKRKTLIEKNSHRILVGKPEGMIQIGIHRRKWEDYVRMDVRKIGWKAVEWMHLAQDRIQWRVLVNMVMNLRLP
jgi:hypothetical protein